MPNPKNDLTIEFVRSVFDLDKNTMELRWKKTISKKRKSRGGNSRPGKIAGNIYTNGYRYVSIKGRYYLVHRLTYLHRYGEWPPGKIDHANNDRLDSSKIRAATDYQNAFNSRKSKKNTSGYKGVSRHVYGKWRAQIVAYGKYHSLGLYLTKELAYAAYCKAAKKLHGKFANFG